LFRNIRFENIRIPAVRKAGIGVTSNHGSVVGDVPYCRIRMEKTFAPIYIKVSDVARVPDGAYRRGGSADSALEISRRPTGIRRFAEPKCRQ
jgi:hypothetical protein